MLIISIERSISSFVYLIRTSISFVNLFAAEDAHKPEALREFISIYNNKMLVLIIIIIIIYIVVVLTGMIVMVIIIIVIHIPIVRRRVVVVVDVVEVVVIYMLHRLKLWNLAFMARIMHNVEAHDKFSFYNFELGYIANAAGNPRYTRFRQEVLYYA